VRPPSRDGAQLPKEYFEIWDTSLDTETCTVYSVAQTSSSDKLTPREVQVLALVAAGLTNYQIARCLEISARTIDKHIEHILAKLAVPSRAAAAAHYATVRATTRSGQR
jgi:DNA-binding CsgD family transcriptional regulator